MKTYISALIFILFGILSLIYFIMLMLTIGTSIHFNYVWLMISVICFGCAFVMLFTKFDSSTLPKPIWVSVKAIILVSFLVFVLVEGMILWSSKRTPTIEPEYVIILGAKVNGSTPSLTLKYRIDRAYDYLLEHPDVKVIVSGGKGNDEGISEAEAMQNRLLSFGIDGDRIILEDQSTSTKENLEFSKQIIMRQHSMNEESIDDIDTPILVVTTDFHVMRAVKIAKKCGFEDAQGLPSKSVWYLTPTNYLREFAAVMKDMVVGNM